MEARDNSFYMIKKRYDRANELAIAIQNPIIFDALRDNFQMQKSLDRIYKILCSQAFNENPQAQISNIIADSLFLAQKTKL